MLEVCCSGLVVLTVDEQMLAKCCCVGNGGMTAWRYLVLVKVDDFQIITAGIDSINNVCVQRRLL